MYFLANTLIGIKCDGFIMEDDVTDIIAFEMYSKHVQINLQRCYGVKKM